MRESKLPDAFAPITAWVSSSLTLSRCPSVHTDSSAAGHARMPPITAVRTIGPSCFSSPTVMPHAIAITVTNTTAQRHQENSVVAPTQNEPFVVKAVLVIAPRMFSNAIAVVDEAMSC